MLDYLYQSELYYSSCRCCCRFCHFFPSDYHMRVCIHSYFFEVHRTFSREGSCEKITYTHVLSRGKTQEQHYGQL